MLTAESVEYPLIVAVALDTAELEMRKDLEDVADTVEVALPVAVTVNAEREPVPELLAVLVPHIVGVTVPETLTDPHAEPDAEPETLDVPLDVAE